MNDKPMLFREILSKFLERYASLYNIQYMTLRLNLYRTLNRLNHKGIVSNDSKKYHRKFVLTDKGKEIKQELIEDIRNKTIFHSISKSIPDKLTKPYKLEVS